MTGLVTSPLALSDSDPGQWRLPGTQGRWLLVLPDTMHEVGHELIQQAADQGQWVDLVLMEAAKGRLESPGTYAHVVTVESLRERAARACPLSQIIVVDQSSEADVAALLWARLRDVPRCC